MTQAEKPQVADIHPDFTPNDEFAEKNKAALALAQPTAPVIALDSLPDSIKSQLVGYGEMELQNQLVECVEAIGSFASVDKIFITLYQRHKREDVKRNKIIATLNALAQEGRIEKQSSPRGYLPQQAKVKA